ncbi:MAG: acyl-CoA dehydrogenase [Methylococcaceae bacterium]|nr:acyl-CoA dehydrogenase [Methylococcaceae bacterium]
MRQTAGARNKFRDYARAGILKHAMPVEFQGYGNAFAELVASHRKLGKSCLDCGLMLSINAHLWGWVFPLLVFGSVEQKSRWLSRSLEGEILGGHAITEPGAGSDISGLVCQANAVGGEFVLNGHKHLISNAPIADFLIVYALLEGKLSAFIVAKHDRGVTIENTGLSACKGSSMGEVILRNCRIPPDRRLGKSGAGRLLIQQALEMERAFVFAGISGIMEWQLETVIDYSRTRMVQGGYLGKHQAISHKIAEMKLRLDTLNLWLSECARLKDAKRRIALAAAQTKLFGGEAFLQSSLDAVQIMGGGGLLEGSLLPGLVNDAMAGRLFSGSSEILKNIIAALSGSGDGFGDRLNPRKEN